MIDRDRDSKRDPLVRSRGFPLGQLLMTPGVQGAVSPIELGKAFRRHARGDWGDLGEEDRRTNDAALKEGGRLLSAYKTEAGVKFWIITEADRSATTALLPDEY